MYVFVYLWRQVEKNYIGRKLFVPYCIFSFERLPLSGGINEVDISTVLTVPSALPLRKCNILLSPLLIAVFSMINLCAAGSGGDPRRRLVRPLCGPCLRDEGGRGQRLEVHGGQREGLGGKWRPSYGTGTIESVRKRRGRSLKSERATFFRSLSRQNSYFLSRQRFLLSLPVFLSVLS